MTQDIKTYAAFYIGRGDWMDWVVRLRHRSRYSRVELVTESEDSSGKMVYIYYSSDPRHDGVRCRVKTTLDTTNWEYIDTTSIISGDDLAGFFRRTFNQRFNWKMVLFGRWLINLPDKRKKKWSDSQWCGTALGYDKKYLLSPKTVYKRLIKNSLSHLHF